MALNTSGPISIGGTVVGQSINLELKLLSTTESSIGQVDFRALAKVLSGQISLSDFYGKSSEVVVPPITTNTLNYVLDPSKVPGYVAGETAVEMTIDTGVFLYSDSSLPALTVTGFVAGDTVKIVNNGAIMGKGGKGGYYAGPTRGQGGTGYPSISLGFSVTIQNNGYILGGGGGGSGPIGVNRVPQNYPGCGGGGGGAGGGDGGEVYTFFGGGGGSYPVAPFGAGGAPGQRGQNAPPPQAGYVKLLPGQLPDYLVQGAGAGGGRVLPGYPGSEGGAGGTAGIQSGLLTVVAPYAQGGGAGGGGGAYAINAFQFNANSYGVGGNGGSNGSPGTTGYQTGGTAGQPTPGTGGGGGWGASGGACFSGLAGGLGGKAIALNGYTATITGAFGIIYGAVS